MQVESTSLLCPIRITLAALHVLAGTTEQNGKDGKNGSLFSPTHMQVVCITSSLSRSLPLTPPLPLLPPLLPLPLPLPPPSSPLPFSPVGIHGVQRMVVRKNRFHQHDQRAVPVVLLVVRNKRGEILIQRPLALVSDLHVPLTDRVHP